ncbi:MFS transporter [Eubacteriales bacterium DFI.9.88]|nr:MFS transporter [Eubacteriales bacterium DFI.9.88]
MKMQMSTKNFDKTRWVALAAALLLMSTLGIGYIWSLLVEPMIELRGATDAGMASIYTALTLTGALMTLIGGKCVDKFGGTKVILSAIIAFAVGELMCALLDGVAGFAAAEVIFLSWQQAVVYIAVYDNVIKMFPDWKGLAVAITCTGIPIGGVYLPPLVQKLIDTVGFDMQFVFVGLILTAIGVISIIFFPNAPKDYIPAGYDTPDYGEDNAAEEDGKFVQKDWKGMLKDPAFYVVFIAPILGSSTYMLLTYQLSWIAQDMLPITAMQSAFLVSGVSVVGIICGIVGPIGDRLNRLLVSVVLFGVGTVCVAGLIFAGDHGVIWFTVCAFAFCFCFGGFATIHPVVVSDLFGSKNFGFNYSICYQSILIASALSPWLGVLGGTDTGDYTKTFTVCTIMCGIGFILMVVLYLMRRNNVEPQIRKVKKAA